MTIPTGPFQAYGRVGCYYTDQGLDKTEMQRGSRAIQGTIKNTCEYVYQIPQCTKNGTKQPIARAKLDSVYVPSINSPGCFRSLLTAQPNATPNRDAPMATANAIWLTLSFKPTEPPEARISQQQPMVPNSGCVARYDSAIAALRHKMDDAETDFATVAITTGKQSVIYL